MWIEIMLTKTKQLYSIFTFCIVSIQSISITSIVRLRNCTHDKINPRQGCMGTYILPNVVLTTSYCAENCQTAEKAKILRYFVHGHYKNFVQSKFTIARNDIALVVIVPEGRRKKLVKLSALDTTSTIGHKALIPVMDERPRLAITMIVGCSKTLTFGYYVCTTNRVTKKSVRVCEERQDQGLPLLLEGRIFGITGINDKCNLAHRSFTAIGPALYWIGSTVLGLGYENSVITTLHDKYVGTTVSIGIVRAGLISLNNFEAYKETAETFSVKSTLPTIALEQSNVKQIKGQPNKAQEGAQSFKKWFFSNAKAAGVGPVGSSREPVINKYKSHRFVDNSGFVPALRYFGTTNSTTTTSTTSTTSTTEDPYAAITFIPALTESTPTPMTTTTMKPTTTKFTIPFLKLNDQKKTTNVMDWFNAEVKDKLKNNPSMYYVVSSSTTTRRSTIFIDLT